MHVDHTRLLLQIIDSIHPGRLCLYGLLQCFRVGDVGIRNPVELALVFLYWLCEITYLGGRLNNVTKRRFQWNSGAACIRRSYL